MTLGHLSFWILLSLTPIPRAQWSLAVLHLKIPLQTKKQAQPLELFYEFLINGHIIFVKSFHHFAIFTWHIGEKRKWDNTLGRAGSVGAFVKPICAFMHSVIARPGWRWLPEDRADLVTLRTYLERSAAAHSPAPVVFLFTAALYMWLWGH